MKVEPHSVLLVYLKGGNISALRDPEIVVSVVASGIEIYSVSQPLGKGADPDPIHLNLKDQLPPGLMGLYEIEGSLKDGGEDICTIDFLLQLGEFCTTTSAVTAVASVSTVGALASAVPAMRLMLLPALQRRRRTGWRRYLPVPDLKWTIINTALGAVAGLVSTTLLLQQTGVQPLSIVNAVLGMFAGGGLTFGVAYLGALFTYFMSPEGPRDIAVVEGPGDVEVAEADKVTEEAQVVGDSEGTEEGEGKEHPGDAEVAEADEDIEEEKVLEDAQGTEEGDSEEDAEGTDGTEETR